MKTSLLLTAFIFLSLAADAQAYIDPGAGSIFLQMIAAAFFGALFTIKMYWKKIISLFRGERSEETKSEGSDLEK